MSRTARRQPDPAAVAAAMQRADRANHAAPSAATLRRWQSADTHRLNSDHWSDAGSRPRDINTDLSAQGPTLRARCEYERENNPYVDGMINTHATDLIGSRGPTLRVESSDDRFNDRLERLWREVFDDLDHAGDDAGPEILATAVGLWWTAGEHLLQITTRREAETLVKTRVALIHPDLLATPFDRAGDENLTLGIERRNGRRATYWLEQTIQRGDYTERTGRGRPIPADAMIHQFRRRYPGQERGIPWLAASLDAAADLRDFDAETLTAARNAAQHSVLLSTDHPDAPFLSVNTTLDVERGTVGTLPPGWKPTAVQAQHPTAPYVDYRTERLRDIGRPAQMPLMTIRLGSERHNYSSARFDGQVYLRSLFFVHGWTERRTLNPLVWIAAREARLAGELGRRPPDARLAWTWPRPPHVDPLKEANAEAVQLQNGTLDLETAAANHGHDLETLIAKRRRVARALAAAGLPPARGQTASAPADETADETDRAPATP